MNPSLPNLTTTALAALLVLAAPAARAEEWRDLPYAEIAKMPLAMAKVDPQHIFTANLVATPGKDQAALPPDFKLRLKLKDQLIPIAVAADGRVSLPFRQDWADAGAQIETNQAKGRVAVSLGFDSRVPPGTKMSYAQLTESAPVLEKAIKQVAGLASMMAPGIQSLTLTFDKPPQTLELSLPDGTRHSYKTDAKGVIELPWEPKWAAGSVQLSAPVKRIDQNMK